MESKVDDTLSDSRGSLRKTRVRPFCFEKTRMMNADSLISDKVIDRGIVRPDAAARGLGDVKLGFESRYVFNGFACGEVLLATGIYQGDPCMNMTLGLWARQENKVRQVRIKKQFPGVLLQSRATAVCGRKTDAPWRIESVTVHAFAVALRDMLRRRRIRRNNCAHLQCRMLRVGGCCDAAGDCRSCRYARPIRDEERKCRNNNKRTWTLVLSVKKASPE